MPDIDISQLAGMFNPQQMSTKQQLINTALSVGGDLATNYFLSKMGVGGSTIPGGAIPFTTPLQGGAFGPSTGFMGTAGTAGAIGYGVGKLMGEDSKTSTAMGAGAAIGTAVGGPIGGIVGGAIGKIIGCFLPDTLVQMSDGSEKRIIDIELKDNIAIGGRVFALGKFVVDNLFDYKGIKVSGDHLVNENGKWLKVKDSKFSKSLGNDEHIVYTLGADNRRMLINNILFTDFFDIEEQKALAA